MSMLMVVFLFNTHLAIPAYAVDKPIHHTHASLRPIEM